MPNIRQPRSGSLQYWPRKRSKRKLPRIRTQPFEDGFAGFVGYKVGMTHVVAIETSKHSPKKGEEIAIPVTIIECPPLKISRLRLYKKKVRGRDVVKEIKVSDKKGKTKKLDLEKLGEFDQLSIVVKTQPKLTSTGKKTPDYIEFALNGSVEDVKNFLKENIGKEISVEKIFSEGDVLDIKSVTKGKGFQGPVKRFGIAVRQAKSEKAIRNPGSLGPWSGQGHIMWRVAHAGKMGYHQRTEYNKQILKITDAKEVTPKGGFVKYGKVNNSVLLVKGSVSGPRKRAVVMIKGLRKKQKALPTIEYISTTEKQGN
jgi:large subunit ribosomal protein L3